MAFFSRPGGRLLFASLLLVAPASRAQPTSPQAGIDDAAIFHQARAQTAPAQRIAALNDYLNRFPSGPYRNTAQELLLKTYLNTSPDQTAPIHQLATALIAAAPAGFERWAEQARIADLLAGAAPAGADLKDAQLWAQSALDSLTETAYHRETTLAHIRYNLPKLTPTEIHEQFVLYRATFLAAAAHVSLQQHQPSRAEPLLDEAFRLNPLSGEVNALRGQFALTKDQQTAALDDFERADAIGALSPALQAKELELFQAQNPQQQAPAAALDTKLDEVYRSLYPPLYTLPPRQLPPGGHTALLELFTGSGCLPCAGPDLAVESLLASYTRQDLAVLEYDQHIPRPDPLATPDSTARTAFYDVESTPAAFLDGQSLQILGASRQDVENTVIGFADQIENQAAIPSGIRLAVTPSQTAGDLKADITLTLAPLPPNLQPDETTGNTSLRALSRAKVFAALVQDNLRYSGENGIRFHRMVVRSLQQAPAATFLSANPNARTFTFHLAAIQQSITTYLRDYQTTNDRFGAFHFTATNFPLRKGPLALVVWAQDPATRLVLQTVFVPIPTT